MKTQEEKAKQLYDKIKFETEYNSQPSTVHGMCKKLALICIDEKIELIKSLPISDLMKQDLVENELKVKQKINEL